MTHGEWSNHILVRLSLATGKNPVHTRTSRGSRSLDKGAEFAIKLPAKASNIATMRRFLAHALVLCDSTTHEGEAALVLSELLSNALEYGASAVLSVVLRVEVDRLTIEVADESPNEPRLRDPGSGRNGRGLRIVDGVADDWGWSFPDDGHKVVWAALDAEPARGAPR